MNDSDDPDIPILDSITLIMISIFIYGLALYGLARIFM